MFAFCLQGNPNISNLWDLNEKYHFKILSLLFQT